LNESVPEETFVLSLVQSLQFAFIHNANGMTFRTVWMSKNSDMLPM